MASDPTQHDGMDRLERLFHAAYARPPEERAAFLDAACPDDLPLRLEVEDLLRANEAAEADAFLDGGVSELAASALGGLGQPDRTGSRVGPYVILRPLGHGGMGNVYLAVREQPFVQRVAVKIIRRGMATREVLHRFEMERQILASLNHPGIARLLDGGVTDDGLPFFAMEYVEGQPITGYCDDRRLDVGARLRLFQHVCQAVHYAHQSLVLHRDLKPSNILVTDAGEVRLLDFGIAKLLGPDRTPLDEPLTQTGFRMMTPEYASPEQVRGEPLTTASDVYALGVLLYELLTGHRPYRLTRRTTEEIAAVVCSQEPERPSVRAARPEAIPGADGRTVTITPEAVGAARRTSPEWLQRRLRGDLDNIVLMALRKEVGRRYHSADQLGEDVARYLTGQPVAARPATAMYRLRKFAVRHRTAVLAAVLVVVSLVAGLGAALWQAGAARREQDRAEAALVRTEQALRQSEEVTDFLMGLFEASHPAEARGDTITARELLERGLARVEELAGQPLVQAQMLDVIGRVYQSLGRFEESQALLERAVARWREGGTPPETANSLDNLAFVYLDRSRHEDAEALLHEAHALRAARYGAHSAAQAQSLHNLASLASEKGDYTAADSLFRAALALRMELLGPDAPETIHTTKGLAAVLSHRGRFDEAEPLLQEVLRRQRTHYGEVHPNVAATLNDLAILLKNRGDLAAAVPFYQRSLDVRRALYGPHHPDVGVALANYAQLLHEKGAYAEAEPVLVEALAIMRQAYDRAHPNVAWVLGLLARTHNTLGRPDQAVPLYHEALSAHRQAYGDAHPQVAMMALGLADALARQERYREAEGLLREALSIYRSAYGPAHLNIATTLAHLGRLFHMQAAPEQAAQHYEAALAMYREVLPEGHLRTASVLLSYGELLVEHGVAGRAEPLLREGLASRQAALPADSWLVAQGQSALGACLTALERYADAEPLLRTAYAALQTADRPDLLRKAQDRLATLYDAWGRPDAAAPYRSAPPPPATAVPAS